MTDAELLSSLLVGACDVDEQLLADLLAEGVPASVAVRRASRGWWHGGAALLLGGVIALSGAREVAAREVAAPAAAHAASISGGAGALGSAAASIAGAADAANAPARTLDAALAELPVVADTVLFIPDMSAEASPSLQTGQLYTVVSGDTLSGIAQRFYGNGALWATIYNANTSLIADPHWIYPGQVFSIPPAPTGTIPPAQTGQGQTLVGNYTVQPGDSLWAIAQYRYGDPLRWRDIYNANAGAIGANPGLIFSGTVLRMP